MKLAIVGTGYVGLVSGTCFAETGNDVICVDIDQRKMDILSGGQITIVYHKTRGCGKICTSHLFGIANASR